MCEHNYDEGEGVHFQCMNNHYAKFKYYTIKIVGGTDYTNQTPSKHLTEKNSEFKTPKMKKIFMKCVQSRGCTFSMCE